MTNEGAGILGKYGVAGAAEDGLPGFTQHRHNRCDSSAGITAVVVSGFHSPLERKVLGTLLKGRCGLIIILARGMYRKLPALLEEPMRSGRLLLISYEHPSVTRASELTAHRRNDNVRQLADTMYRPSDIEAAGAR